jgi:GAF domain-containing protein
MDRRLVTVNLDNRDVGLMVDIGEAGMAVQALARIKQGATTALQFELPDTAARIEATGTVAWVDTDSGRAGIHFHSLAEASAAPLKQWLGVPVAPDQHRSKPKPDFHPHEAKPGLLGTQERPATPASAPTSAAAAPSAPPRLGPESRVAEIAALQREITSQGLDRDAALTLTAERARSLTRADGIAVLLGDSGRMTCRVSSGSAPPVGAELQPDAGLSGECVRSGVTVRCEDTELDPRVDREACRALNLRSAVVVPLFARGNISGLVEVFYAGPRGFEGRDVLTLRRIADLISATLCGPALREANPPPVASTALPAPRVLRATPPGPMIPPVPRLASRPDRVVCAVCGHDNPYAANACEKCHVPLPIEEGGTVGLGSALFQTQTEAPRRWLTVRLNLSPRLLVLIALLLLLVGIWGWQEYKARQVSGAPPARTTSVIDSVRSYAAAVGPKYAG